MEKLTESAIKNLAHDAGYYFDGKKWVHEKTGDTETTNSLVKKLMGSGKKETVNDLISKKVSATRKKKSDKK
jgi:hypothetical protein